MDRSIDALSPLLHEFTYQAMTMDLLPIDGELLPKPVAKKTGKGKLAEKKQQDEPDDFHILSEDDALWVQFR